MGLKRKRNLKVDTSMRYSVCILSMISDDEPEDYVESHDTGMEADEEKEDQLQKIIKGQGGSIPIPVIENVDNPAREHYKKMGEVPKICWDRDARNEYVDRAEIVGQMERVIDPSHSPISLPEDSPQADDFIPVGRILHKAFYDIGGAVGATGSKDPRLVDYILNRTLIRYEKKGFEAYACFRRRVFHPTFKSRRNESIMLEKLQRMGKEFNGLREMCRVLYDKTECQLEHLCNTHEILKEYHEAELSERCKRLYRRRILGLAVETPPGNIKFNVHSVMTNREKIAYLRSVRPSPELLVDSKHYKGVMGLLERPPSESAAPQEESETCQICQKNKSVFFL